MIFVTVGSRKYPLDRLFKELDELYEDGALCESMFAQIGTSTHQPKHYKSKDSISPEGFTEKINEADIAVSYGASGPIMKALNAGREVITVIRLGKYGGRINDHQIQNNGASSSNGYVLMAGLELDDLDGCFEKMYDGADGVRSWGNEDSIAIVNMIDKFIQGN